MAEESAAKRAANYRRLAAETQAAAERAFDPNVAADLEAIAAKYRKLAERADREAPRGDHSGGAGDGKHA